MEECIFDIQIILSRSPLHLHSYSPPPNIIVVSNIKMIRHNYGFKFLSISIKQWVRELSAVKMLARQQKKKSDFIIGDATQASRRVGGAAQAEEG